MKKVCAIGLMSGTSLDGMDGVLIEADLSRTPYRVRTLVHRFVGFPKEYAPLAREIAKDNKLLEAYRFAAVWSEFAGDLVKKLLRAGKKKPSQIAVIGAHGQTLLHEPHPGPLLGQLVGTTVQLADLSRLTLRTGITTVGNFRLADIAVGGEGAPLAPAAHRMIFGRKGKTLAVQNLGGIGNATLIRKGRVLLAFDTGPANLWIDTTARWCTSLGFDPEGRLARVGKPNESIVSRLLKHPYFLLPPPKSAGWEQFGEAHFSKFRDDLKKLTPPDALATVTEATVKATADAYKRYVFPIAKPDEIILSGGGAKNLFLKETFERLFAPIRMTTSEAYGVSVDSLEAVAFALLAIETVRGRPGNEPAATGASHPVICGVIAPGGQGWKRLLR